jgi:hypothetical protein
MKLPTPSARRLRAACCGAMVGLVLVACGGAPHGSVEAVLAAHPQQDRTIPAQNGRDLAPWSVGQRALYKVSRRSGVSYVIHSVVARGACGYWVEHVEQWPQQRRVVKSCFSSMPRPDMDASARSELLQAVMGREGRRTLVLDFRNGKNPRTKQLFTTPRETGVTLAWESPPSDELGTIVVPAGRFEGSAKTLSRVWVMESMHNLEVWTHPAVPITGAIKATSTTGAEIVLLDFAMTGAKSELPDFDEHLRETGLDD